MSWRFLVLVVLAFTISLGKEPLSSYAEPVAQSSTQVEPKLAQAYVDYYKRAVEKQSRGDNYGAIADYNEAIRLKPRYAEAYGIRGGAKYLLGDHQGAIDDSNKAIRLNPNLAESYTVRGNGKYRTGDKYGALSDYRYAAQLFQQQGNTQWYQKVLENIEIVESSL